MPVLSYVLLKGRCRHCAAPIHWRYPIVELLTAVCFAWFAAHYGFSVAAAKYCVFSALMIGLIFSDLETLILPDEFTIGGIVIGLAFAPFVPVPDQTFALMSQIAGMHLGPHALSFAEAAFGAFVPSITLWLLGWAFEKLRHKEGLGFGDVKMIAAVGAFLGIEGALLTVILGSIAGSVIGLIYIKAAHKDAASFQLPFASFLGAAAMVAAILSKAA